MQKTSYHFGVSQLHEIRTTCRVCDSRNLAKVLDFGDIALTGVFLSDGSDVDIAPLELVICSECGLSQLRHTYSVDALYGESYGYESHLNSSMVNHLQAKARLLQGRFLESQTSPVVVDIASNDGTLLAGYTQKNMTLIGIDPLIDTVSDCYPEGSIKVKDFFNSKSFFSAISSKASLVTSLSVLYDLDSPIEFASNIYDILADEGVWHFEQSYLPTMVDTLSYDTICHEHLLYLRLKDIVEILKRTNFKLIDVTLNNINGGSIAVTAIKTNQNIKPDPFVSHLLAREEELGYLDGSKLQQFADDAKLHAANLRRLIKDYIEEGFTVFGLGASTKGNALLQLCGIQSQDVRFIGDINPRKFGRQTPGSCIPIVDEIEVLGSTESRKIALVLPWHFRDGIVKKAEGYLTGGGKLLFPLPSIEVV